MTMRGGEVSKSHDIAAILDFAIGEEIAAAAFYTDLAQRTTRPDLREALMEFAREEEGHRARLEAIRAGAATLAPSQSVASLKVADYLVDVAPDPQMSYREALVVAINKEKAAYRLYSDLAARAAESSLRDAFLALAAEEARHRLRFEMEYDDLLVEN